MIQCIMSLESFLGCPKNAEEWDHGMELTRRAVLRRRIYLAVPRMSRSSRILHFARNLSLIPRPSEICFD